MLQEQDNRSQQSPSASNSDLNSLASDDDNEENNNNKLSVNLNSSLLEKSGMTREHNFIDEHQQKQIHRMKAAPPAPPSRKSSDVSRLQSVSRRRLLNVRDS